MQLARTLRRTLQVGCLAVLLGACLTFLPTALAQADATPDTEKWLVNDAEVFAAVNIKQMVGSEVLKTGGKEALKGLINSNAQVKTILDATGIDPFTDIHSIVISGSVASAKDVKALVVVRGKFDTDKVHSAAEKFSKKNPDALKLDKSGSTNLYQVKVNDMPLVGAFLDGSALVLTPTKDATLETIKTLGKKPAKVNKDLKEALAKFDGNESLAIGLVVNDEMKKALGKIPQTAELAPKLQTVTGSVKLTDAATTSLTVNTEDAKTAAKLETVLKQLKSLAELMVLNNEEVGPIASKILEQTKITTTRNSVTLSLKVTKDLIEGAKKDKDKDK